MTQAAAGKVCTTCGQDKPLAAYHKRANGRGGIQSQCADCTNAYSRAWKAANRTEARLARERARQADYKRRAIAVHGGACVECGATEGLLLDHIDGGGGAHRKQESNVAYNARIAISGVPDPRLQVMCGPCHKPKTSREQSEANRRRWAARRVQP